MLLFLEVNYILSCFYLATSYLEIQQDNVFWERQYLLLDELIGDGKKRTTIFGM